MIHEVSPYSITQELVTDCSFVSSLCIAAANGHFEVVKVLREHGASVAKCACNWQICVVFCCCCWLPYCPMERGTRNLCSAIPVLAGSSPARPRAPPAAPEPEVMDRLG